MEETAEQQEPSSGLEGADPPDRSAGRETGSIPFGGGSKASLGRKIHLPQEVLEAGIKAMPKVTGLFVPGENEREFT